MLKLQPPNTLKATEYTEAAIQTDPLPVFCGLRWRNCLPKGTQLELVFDPVHQLNVLSGNREKMETADF